MAKETPTDAREAYLRRDAYLQNVAISMVQAGIDSRYASIDEGGPYLTHAGLTLLEIGRSQFPDSPIPTMDWLSSLAVQSAVEREPQE